MADEGPISLECVGVEAGFGSLSEEATDVTGVNPRGQEPVSARKVQTRTGENASEGYLRFG